MEGNGFGGGLSMVPGTRESCELPGTSTLCGIHVYALVQLHTQTRPSASPDNVPAFSSLSHTPTLPKLNLALGLTHPWSHSNTQY